MTAVILDGKYSAQCLRQKLAQNIKENVAAPKLAVIWIGTNEASGVYVRNKQKAAQEVGIVCDIYHLSENTTEADVIDLINRLNQDVSVNGILVQLPLPEGLNEHHILETVAPSKDVDAFTQAMVGALWQNHAPWASATPEGVLYLLKQSCPNLTGKHAVIIGRSNIVGKPMAALLLNENCTVTVAHSKTQNLSDVVRMADIVIAACGCPKLIKKDWIKSGALVIDVGITRVDGKLYGDVDFDEVKDIASVITPVPGGVGPMTIAMLLQNTYTAYLKQMDRL